MAQVFGVKFRPLLGSFLLYGCRAILGTKKGPSFREPPKDVEVPTRHLKPPEAELRV